MSGNQPPPYLQKNPTPAARTAMANSPFNIRFGGKTVTTAPARDLNDVYVGDLFSGSSLGGKSYYNIDVVKSNWPMLSAEASKQVRRDAQDYAGWKNPVPLDRMEGFYSTLVDIAHLAKTQFGENVTPLTAYAWYARKFGKKLGSAAGGSAAGGSSGGGGGPAAPTKRINLTDPDTANGLVDNALEQYLGRRANNQEQDAFRKALRKAEMKNPVSAEIVGDTAVTKGGVSPSVRAEEFAMAQEGSAEYQAGTTYYDAFISAIKNPVGI